MRTSEIRKIAFVGDYLPRKCGIATFTHDMYGSLSVRFPAAERLVVPVNDRPDGYEYPPEVRFEIDEQDLESYLRAADFLNFANTDVVCLQHEYGIYGGVGGSHVLGLMRDLRMPVVTTLHTVLRDPSAEQHRVLKQVAELSARLIVMSERARIFLRDVYKVPDAKIIGFPRGAAAQLPGYVEATGVNAVSIDWTAEPSFIRERVQSKVAVQGNLDPLVLIAGGDALNRAVDNVIENFGKGRLIFNLGHGIQPETPIAHVEQMLKRVRG